MWDNYYPEGGVSGGSYYLWAKPFQAFGGRGGEGGEEGGRGGGADLNFARECCRVKAFGRGGLDILKA